MTNELKGFNVLIQAFIKSGENHDWNLILIGNINPKVIHAVEQARSILGEERVKLVEFVSDKSRLFQYYSMCKVYIAPSINESFGISIVEALYNQCYLICSDGVGPCKEFVPNAVVGTIVRAGDIDDLSKAISKATKINFDKHQMEELQKHYETFSYKNNLKYLHDAIEMKIKNKRNLALNI